MVVHPLRKAACICSTTQTSNSYCPKLHQASTFMQGAGPSNGFCNRNKSAQVICSVCMCTYCTASQTNTASDTITAMLGASQNLLVCVICAECFSLSVSDRVMCQDKRPVQAVQHCSSSSVKRRRTFRYILQWWIQAVGVVLSITLVAQQDVLPVLILPADTAPLPRSKGPANQSPIHV